MGDGWQGGEGREEVGDEHDVTMTSVKVDGQGPFEAPVWRGRLAEKVSVGGYGKTVIKSKPGCLGLALNIEWMAATRENGLAY